MTDSTQRLREMIDMAETPLKRAMDQVDQLDDENLNLLVDYIRYQYKARRHRRITQNMAELRVGDRVVFRGPRKPQYLEGLMGKIEEKRQSRVVVKLDRPVGKFTSGRVLTSASGLERVG